jgi:hypothetical protein
MSTKIYNGLKSYYTLYGNIVALNELRETLSNIIKESLKNETILKQYEKSISRERYDELKLLVGDVESYYNMSIQLLPIDSDRVLAIPFIGEGIQMMFSMLGIDYESYISKLFTSYYYFDNTEYSDPTITNEEWETRREAWNSVLTKHRTCENGVNKLLFDYSSLLLLYLKCD